MHSFTLFGIGAFFSGFAAWAHNAFRIRPRQLIIKAHLPEPVKAALQAEVDQVVPALAAAAETKAQQAIAGLAATVQAKLGS